MNKKLIFLDIDGVLNYAECEYTDGGIYFVDPEKILLLKQIIDITGAEVVLSSTWRFGWALLDLEGYSAIERSGQVRQFLNLKRELHKYGVVLKYRTPMINGYDRSLEISRFLQNYQDRVGHSPDYVILDDNFENHDNIHLVLTKFSTGLTQADVDKAIKILNDNNYMKQQRELEVQRLEKELWQ